MELPRWILLLERRVSFLKIPHLGFLLLILQTLGWFFLQKDPSLAEKFSLEPSAVLSGEWFRLFSFLIIPVSEGIFLFLLLWFFFFVVYVLARKWGDFKVTLYFFLGWVGTILGSFLFWTPVDSAMLLETTFFFALATLVPNFDLLLFFILPLKMKWVGLSFAVVLALQLILFGAARQALCLLFSCLNYLLFFGPSLFTLFVEELKKRRSVS